MYIVYIKYFRCMLIKKNHVFLVQTVDRDRLLINQQEKDIWMRYQLKLSCISLSGLQISCVFICCLLQYHF